MLLPERQRFARYHHHNNAMHPYANSAAEDGVELILENLHVHFGKIAALLELVAWFPIMDISLLFFISASNIPSQVPRERR